MKDNTIAIMGGSFNPFHKGHLELAIQAHIQYGLEHILVMPSYNPVSYKDTSEMAEAKHRCNMIKAAIEPYPYMELSMLEIERGGRTYTADTLKELKNIYDYIYFIIGADSLMALDRWYDAAYVLSNCHFLAANRNGLQQEELDQRAEYLCKEYGASIDFLKIPDLPYSSSVIRDRIEAGLPVDTMVPPEVNRYIIQHKLYR